MKFALHPPIPSNLPPRTSNLSLFIPLRALSHSSPVTPLFATLTQNNPGWGGAFILSAVDQRFPSRRKKPASRLDSEVPKTCSCNPFRINTCKSVSKQRTSSPFGINTYKKQGGGGALRLTWHPVRFFVSSTSFTSSISFPSFHLRPLFTLAVRRKRRNPFYFWHFRTFARTTGVGGDTTGRNLTFYWSFP